MSLSYQSQSTYAIRRQITKCRVLNNDVNGPNTVQHRPTLIKFDGGREMDCGRFWCASAHQLPRMGKFVFVFFFFIVDKRQRRLFNISLQWPQRAVSGWLFLAIHDRVCTNGMHRRFSSFDFRLWYEKIVVRVCVCLMISGDAVRHCGFPRSSSNCVSAMWKNTHHTKCKIKLSTQMHCHL